MTPTRFSMVYLLSVPVLLSALMLAHAESAGAPSSEKERAVIALEQDLKTDPTNAELWLHAGFAYRKAGKIDQAQSAFEKASTINPHEADAFYMLGLIYESKHQTQEAEKAWASYLSAETNPEKRAVAQKHIHHLSQ